MTVGEAKAIVAGRTPDCSNEEVIAAWQHLVDTGEVWHMESWYGITAAAMISTGKIYGND